MKRENKKTVNVDLSVWYNERTDHIHFSGRSDKFRFISTVNKNPDSKRCHRHLYGHLSRLLKEHNRWPVKE